MKLSIFISLILFSSLAMGQSFGTGGGFSFGGNKESARWTLAGWLKQKEKFRLQDHWLAMNKQANFFEFGVFGSQQRYDKEANGVTVSETAIQYSAALWLSIFGLQYTHMDSSEDFTRDSLQLNVRLFGQSAASTNLTAYYGQTNTEYETTGLDYKNDFAGADLKLYIVDMFGLTGSYSRDFEGESSLNTKYEGSRYSYGAFIELFVVRLSAEMFHESIDVQPSSGSARTDSREGVRTGIQFYL